MALNGSVMYPFTLTVLVKSEYMHCSIFKGWPVIPAFSNFCHKNIYMVDAIICFLKVYEGYVLELVCQV